MENPLIHLRARHLNRQIGGLFAVCSSHPMVLETAMELAVEENRPLLVEATANQVNQSGGYTGMTPADFSAFIHQLSKSVGLPAHQLTLGADHLGPHIWKNEPAAKAMEKAVDLAYQCVAAGFLKIHLDTGTCCGDDPGTQLPPEIAAKRAALICRSAEASASERPNQNQPLYVIGNEVPPPGGGLEEDQPITITDPDNLVSTLKLYEQAFDDIGVASAWQRVVAVVAQPGVEFGDRAIAAYDRDRAAALSAAHARLPAIMTYEIHATDYQRPAALRQMVQDHFLLLKTGPCLSYAFREAVYALTFIEDTWSEIREPSHLRNIMETLMKTHPVHWQTHYRGDPGALSFLRHYSFRDRIRYYWSHPDAIAALNRLIKNFEKPIPSALLRQFFPDLFPEIDCGALSPSLENLIKRRIRNALTPYVEACR
jgi:D-tagatose-1,6-bisphosphate aldolase subunit GatZ/KbaZ